MYAPHSSAASEPGFVEARERISSCAVEVEASWQALQCLTPDATQLSEAEWQPQMPQGLKGAFVKHAVTAMNVWVRLQC